MCVPLPRYSSPSQHSECKALIFAQNGSARGGGVVPLTLDLLAIVTAIVVVDVV